MGKTPAYGFNQVKYALGYGTVTARNKDGTPIYNPAMNATQRLNQYYQGLYTNQNTDWSGYGQYYVDGKFYANKDTYLHELWEEELNSGNPVGSFEYWKEIHGYNRTTGSGGGYVDGSGKWVPYNASGTDYWYGGRTLVGENGPEEVVLPRGSRITSASETRYSGAPVVHVGQIVIDAKNVREFNDVVRIMMNERISTRMEAK